MKYRMILKYKNVNFNNPKLGAGLTGLKRNFRFTNTLGASIKNQKHKSWNK